MGNLRTYKELSKLKSFEDRYNYLKLDSKVGAQTFGADRWLNQVLYKSKEWKDVRDRVITRDLGMDLGDKDTPIQGKEIIIHHMNPITEKQIIDRDPDIMNPDYLISCSLRTHNAIHYGDESQIPKGPIVRTKNDTCPWKN